MNTSTMYDTNTTTMPYPIGAAYDVLMSPTDTKFCDLHHYDIVKDVHGAALSLTSIIACICFTIRVFSDPRSSNTLKKFCVFEIIQLTFATNNHVFGLKLNDFCLTTWSVFVVAPTILQLYEEKEEGGPWYFDYMPKQIYKLLRLVVPFSVFDPIYSPISFFVFVLLPFQPRRMSPTMMTANVFILLSLGPIFYEFWNGGRCPNFFPVHAISDACVLFFVFNFFIHIQDVDLGVHTYEAKKKQAELAAKGETMAPIENCKGKKKKKN